jgi:hypothetical protein
MTAYKDAGDKNVDKEWQWWRSVTGAEYWGFSPESNMRN